MMKELNDVDLTAEDLLGNSILSKASIPHAEIRYSESVSFSKNILVFVFNRVRVG